MKRILIGLTIGAVIGAVAFKKMEQAKIPEKALKTAQEKICEK